MKKVIIDCDVGVDDAFALIFAFHSPELEVKAVTGVNGNVPLSQVFENMQKVLSLIRPSHRPLIAKGADHPLKGKPVYAHSIHGKEGLGGVKIELEKGEEWWQYSSRPADDLITTLAHQYPNELTLIATGPLTNVALALQKDPAGMKKLKEISIMGGAIRTKGNVTPDAEFNIFSDPLAAKKVFKSGLPIILVPLDVTHQVFLTPQWIEERLNPIHNSFSQFVIEAIGYNITAHRFLRSSDLIYLHDPLAVGVVIDPTLVRTEPLSLDVNIQEGEHYGLMTEVSGRSKINVCLEVDAAKFLALFLSRLR